MEERTDTHRHLRTRLLFKGIFPYIFPAVQLGVLGWIPLSLGAVKETVFTLLRGMANMKKYRTQPVSSQIERSPYLFSWKKKTLFIPLPEKTTLLISSMWFLLSKPVAIVLHIRVCTWWSIYCFPWVTDCYVALGQRSYGQVPYKFSILMVFSILWGLKQTLIGAGYPGDHQLSLELCLTTTTLWKATKLTYKSQDRGEFADFSTCFSRIDTDVT